jgi:uncharacterized protein (DUF433 family)
MATVAYPHIEIADGVPILSGTRTKVVEIVLDRLAYHWDADEINRQHPHLSLAQIYSALAYYYDHQSEMDQGIQAQLQDVERVKSGQPTSPLRLRLKSIGRLP